ncbi:dephospho-CoA kinase [Chromatium okenii]|uniref:dephospho-CoA kinase n=1 Tax=Chromatium okenii TaxID=61644 RepID=UPI0019058388|nr:dephospho-CoA kinase [Chromatium okenii]MBK1640651.1 dephospho-CoA kinase [Chromatium okenii]
MYSVALTGGIGSGKSTVAAEFATLGAGVIDTDLLARELTAVGQPLLTQIAAACGADVLLADGSLDRAALRERVFQQPRARARLEAILHPAILELMLARRAALTTPYALLVIPLLFETGQQTVANRVLVVDVAEAVQIERVQQRSGLAPDEIQRIIASQIPRHERCARADDLLENSGAVTALLPQIAQLHAEYLRLAQS